MTLEHRFTNVIPFTIDRYTLTKMAVSALWNISEDRQNCVTWKVLKHRENCMVQTEPILSNCLEET